MPVFRVKNIPALKGIVAALVCAALSACAGSGRPQLANQTPIDRPAAGSRPAPVQTATPPRGTSVNAVQPNPSARDLQSFIDQEWRQFPGKTGVAVLNIETGEIAGKRLPDLFPQQSVSKSWVALTVLDLVDQGRLRLDQNVRITPSDIAVFYQPIAAEVIRKGEVNESVYGLLERAITASDNTANDSLLRIAGGPAAVRAFIAKHGLGAIRFGPGERLLQSGIAGLQWNQEYATGRRFYEARSALPYETRKAALDRYLADPVDGASPEAIAGALARLAKGELLSPASTQLILGLMARTSSGPNRLKAGVPAGWRFLHKTGTGQILDPVSTGYNDIGIMTAPDGTRYAVAVMMADTTAPVPERMRFMQAMSRAVADYHIPR